MVTRHITDWAEDGGLPVTRTETPLLLRRDNLKSLSRFIIGNGNTQEISIDNVTGLYVLPHLLIFIQLTAAIHKASFTYFLTFQNVGL
jgi:hypothetical protein